MCKASASSSAAPTAPFHSSPYAGSGARQNLLNKSIPFINAAENYPS